MCVFFFYFFLLEFDSIINKYTSLACWPAWCLITHTGLSSKPATQRFTPFKFSLARLRH